MSNHDTLHRALPAAYSFRRRPSRLWHLWSAYCEWRRRNRDYARLEELPAYLLDDVGLTRWQIEAARRQNTL